MTFSDYVSSVSCYQDLLERQVLSACSDVWDSVDKKLRRINAFQFYCEPDSVATSKIKQ